MAEFKNDGSMPCHENLGTGFLTIYNSLNGQNRPNPTIRGWGFLLYLGRYNVSAFFDGDLKLYTRTFTSFLSDHLAELEKELLLELVKTYYRSAPASPLFQKLEAEKPSSEQ